MKKRIIFFHLLNDYSGSPHVLSLIIKGLVEKGYLIDLYTSKHKGFLSDIDGVKYYEVYYDFLKNKIVTFILYLFAQFRYFIAIFKYIGKKDTIVYINTILPFGAMLGAFLIRKKAIYHIHEFPVNRNPVNNMALYVFRKFADKTIFVSNYLNDCFNVEVQKRSIIYNALSPSFVEKARKNRIQFTKPYNILMVCSLRIFKGVLVFVELAKLLPNFKFTLVLNSSNIEIKKYFKDINLSENIEIFPTQTNLDPFYSKANLLVNLSLPNLCVETFGLTALEAMVYGTPVIVPPVGGIAEIVDEGIQGFQVDARDTDRLLETIKHIFSDEKAYYKLSTNAILKTNNFSFEKMVDKVEKVINEI